ncbi:PQQ-binding-like beta-propeller repeat protein [Defluviimonas sp. D31]|uniref:outer membrane protein assembly factor BamB family protein n=1 Tax=Defluviimonas sp. D31 TaxID=3083253 RepID=UPI00296F41A6|nr:PQQ-binding-like beta-propeller repeat protein [Defluviimonas sp. D31]MDW4548889.1 PQQ-binding-like beta-propeller repeat protein [Defluviimonas sp. D31]
MISRAIGAAGILVLVSACTDPEVILEGERQDVRAAAIGTDATAIAPAPVTAAPISLPAMQRNADWTHRGGSATHRIGHVALSASPTPVWSARIGAGDGRRNRITSDPVVAAGRVFTLDSKAMVTATGTNGATLWQADLTPPSERSGDASGGGLAYGEGRVFATSGYGELIALDPASGATIWRQRFDAAVGGAPAVSDGRVYVVARDASAWAVRASDGKVEWVLPGAPSNAGVMGAAAPAVDARQVVFPFASGQMVAAAKDSGVGLWNASVAGQRRGRAYATVSDLTGDPVIADGVVYAGTSAGRLSAVNADTGLTLWSARDGAMSPVAVAGGAVFFVNDEDQLMRLDASSGAEVWRVDMPYFTKDRDKRRRDIVAHYGPVLAGGRLVIASSDGLIRSFSPASGALVATTELPGGAASAPAVAGGVLYVVSKSGTLQAFR